MAVSQIMITIVTYHYPTHYFALFIFTYGLFALQIDPMPGRVCFSYS